VVRKCDFENLSPVRLPFRHTGKFIATTYDNAPLRCLTLSLPHRATFAKLLDRRKQAIRGLWVRGAIYYAPKCEICGRLKSLGKFKAQFSAKVEPHGVVAVKVMP
jgi:hypothetical protein